MKILIVSHRFPYPPTSGTRIRTYHMIRHLARDHDVTVASLVRSAAEAAQGHGIEALGVRYEMARVREPVQALRMVARLASVEPSSMGYFRSNALARRIDALLASATFDLIIVHSSSVAQYVLRNTATPKLIDFCDMDSQKWLAYASHKPFPLSLGYALEGRKLARAERRIASRFDLCTTATPLELETLESYGTARATDWFPIGVDGEFFQPAQTPHEAETLVFVGRMDYYPNETCMVEFCSKVLPVLQRRRPALQLLIVGADPGPATAALSKLSGVTVTGSVPDVRPYLQRATAIVAPLHIARGTQTKILEGMAAGVPVVSSRIAAGGVDARAPEHLLVASTTDEYVMAIERVLDDPTERARLARAGRERALSHLAWEPAMRRLDRIIDRCLASARSREPRTAPLGAAR